MVVPAGESGTTNNDQGVVVPAAGGFCLHDLLQQDRRRSNSSSSSNLQTKQFPHLEMEAAAAASGNVKDQAAAAAATAAPNWAFSAPELVTSSRGTTTLDEASPLETWPGRSSLLQQILGGVPQEKSNALLFSQQQQQQPAGLFDIETAAAAAKLRSLRAVPPDKSAEILSPNNHPLPQPQQQQQQRRDDYVRGGKMTSLGASPKCNVCSHKPNEARVVTFCGHLFCWPCLCCWLHNKSPNKECPVCNRPLTKNHITPLHGRQNSLTVARLQGMLRTEKTTPRSHSGSRGEGRRQSRVSSASAAAAAAAAASSSSSSSGNNGSPQIASASSSKVGDSIRRLLNRQQSPSLSRGMLVDEEASPGSNSSSVPVAPALPESVVGHLSSLSPLHHHQFPSVFPSVPSMPTGSISTASTVVTTTSTIPVEQAHSSNFSAAVPAQESILEEGSGEMKELGVLLSLEWEGAMSAIENAWWGAVSMVLDRNEDAGEDASALMTSVERLSKEKEKIIHELASSGPLEGSQWLSARLDTFKSMSESPSSRKDDDVSW